MKFKRHCLYIASVCWLIAGISLFILLINLNGCSGWKTKDKILFGTYTALNGVDIIQTREILTSPKYKELNPLFKNLTPNEATGVMILANSFLIYPIANYLPEKYRTPFLGGAVAMKIGIVGHNYSLGRKGRW